MTPVRISIAASIASALLLLVVLELIRGRRLKERYALLWLGDRVVLLVLSAWRGGLNTIAGWLGVGTYPPAILFAAATLFIISRAAPLLDGALPAHRRERPAGAAAGTARRAGATDGDGLYGAATVTRPTRCRRPGHPPWGAPCSSPPARSGTASGRGRADRRTATSRSRAPPPHEADRNGLGETLEPGRPASPYPPLGARWRSCGSCRSAGLPASTSRPPATVASTWNDRSIGDVEIPRAVVQATMLVVAR